MCTIICWYSDFVDDAVDLSAIIDDRPTQNKFRKSRTKILSQYGTSVSENSSCLKKKLDRNVNKEKRGLVTLI